MTEELIATLRKEQTADDDRLEYGSGQPKEQPCGDCRALGTSRAGGSWARHGSGCI